ncbi:DUF4386 domain-containing protein [Brevibacillus reuszeri]|uniref:DUF4386 domain-containing protein n=1 Tax=Brevibacillus reuszeri TaxID=54915 RepID=A0A0K9YRW2_9BACL|nr:DUF4386 domain-containing protein [Brevibacillus reuszeri]KNB71469.1 hypothetical protein ADS79_22085 [Brevibacillus reuszeri]MED1855735.1 DUF4386 domain-containing protein [Brevibacillus reuszeri]GED67114.1 DUF4386 domain-containing protein [Brevibacillus reuszeri]
MATLSERKSAVIAGTSIIIMALAAFFSYGFVHESLVVTGDASTTYTNITTSISLFKGEIFGWLIILISDIIVAWALYIFLKPINKSLSLLAAWLRLIYSTILGIAILSLIVVLLLATDSTGLSVIKIEQVQSFMLLFLQAFEAIWSIGLIVFGAHLLMIGYVALQSSSIPKVISILLLLASIGYIIIHLSKTFFTQYDSLIAILNLVFMLPMVAGELGFGIWLLVKGGKLPKRA